MNSSQFYSLFQIDMKNISKTYKSATYDETNSLSSIESVFFLYTCNLILEFLLFCIVSLNTKIFVVAELQNM